MDRVQIDRLSSTLDNLISIRSNMETILRDLTATQAEMQQKLIQTKQNDVPGAADRLLHILKQQTSQMSQSVDQMQIDNEHLTTAVKSELSELLQKSSKQKDRISECTSGPGAGPADQLLAVALLDHPDDEERLDVDELRDELRDESSVSDAHDLTSEPNTQNSFSIH